MTLGYHSLGHGPEKIIFLHGWLSDHLVYEPLFPLLDQDRYTAVFPDYRGYGQSSHLDGDYSIAEIARDVIELAKHLKWSHCHIAGHSTGGMVLQKIACLTPNLVASGIAITPVPASGLPLTAQLTSFFKSAIEDDGALTELYDVLTGKRYSGSFLTYMTGRTRRVTTRAALLGYMNAWTGTDISAEVAALESKILVIAGRFDGAVGPDVMEQTYLKQLHNVELVTIEGAGHYPAQETPVELFTAIEHHLKENAFS